MFFKRSRIAKMFAGGGLGLSAELAIPIPNADVIAQVGAILRREVTDNLIFPLDIPGVNKRQ